jgi:thymidylate synthase (FAD)
MQAELIDHMGTDLTVVNAARCSFSAVSNELTKGDIGLINFLARGCMSKDWVKVVDELTSTNWQEDPNGAEGINDILKWAKNMPTHWTPFAHAMITMRETVPIFVARQRFKHVVGFSYNEVSRRYVDDSPGFHMPGDDGWRARPVGGIKQGSGGVADASYMMNGRYEQHMIRCESLYEDMIGDGIAPEQARMVLPQSMLTTYWVTGSLYAWANAYIQRSDPHAQGEIQQLAAQWDTIIQPLFPESWKALTK